MRRMVWSVCALCAASVAGGGCGGILGRRPSLYTRLQSDDHAVRAAAVVEAGQRQDARAVPYLVERLEDEGADIRLFAIEALRRIVGRDFGFRSYASEAERREAVRQWRHWLGSDLPPGAGNVAGTKDLRER